MEYNLIKTKENPPRYILESGEKLFSINDVLFEILMEYKTECDYEKISIKVNTKFRNENLINKDIVKSSIIQVRNLILNDNNGQKNIYINNRFKIMKGRNADRIYGVFSFLYNKDLFAILSTIFTIVSIFFFSVNEIGFKEAYITIYESFNVKTIMTSYLFFFIIIFLHEVGHATAAYYFGEKPKEIGFGIYFIFPVLYTDTTNIWKLNKRDRIVVNLGGIYMQLIINVLLIGLFYILDGNILVKVLIIMNTISMIASFNPFFRYDGYWIYSDWFKISNLKYKTSEITKMILLRPKKILKNLKNINKPLLIYALLNIIFWVIVTILLMKHFIINLKNIYERIIIGNWMSFSILREGMLLILTSLLIYNTFNRLNTKKNE